LQHIDFPLPRKHKPALFSAIATAPLTTTAGSCKGCAIGVHRDAPFIDHSMQILGKRTMIDSPAPRLNKRRRR
jgi:hypothetical protein